MAAVANWCSCEEPGSTPAQAGYLGKPSSQSATRESTPPNQNRRRKAEYRSDDIAVAVAVAAARQRVVTLASVCVHDLPLYPVPLTRYYNTPSLSFTPLSPFLSLFLSAMLYIPASLSRERLP